MDRKDKKKIAVIGWNAKDSYTEIWNQVDVALARHREDSTEYVVELFYVNGALPDLTVEGMAKMWGKVVDKAKKEHYVAIVAIGERINACLNKVLGKNTKAARCFSDLAIPLLYTVGGSQLIGHPNAFLCWGPNAGDMAQYAAYYARRHAYENVMVLACVPESDLDYAQTALLSFKKQFVGEITERIIKDERDVLQLKDCAQCDFIYVTGIGGAYARQIKCLVDVIASEGSKECRRPDVLTDHSVLGLSSATEIPKLRYVGLGMQNLVSFFVEETIDIIKKANSIRDERSISLVDVIQTMSVFNSVRGDIPLSFTQKREIRTPVFLCGEKGRISDDRLKQDVICSMGSQVTETDFSYLLKEIHGITLKLSEISERSLDGLWESLGCDIETLLQNWVSIFKLKGMGLVIDTWRGRRFPSTYDSESLAESYCFSFYRCLRDLGFDIDNIQVNLSGGDLGDTSIARLFVFRMLCNRQSEEVKEVGLFNIADYPTVKHRAPGEVPCDGDFLISALIADNPCSERTGFFSHPLFDGDRRPELLSEPMHEWCNSCIMIPGSSTFKAFEELVSSLAGRSDGANFVYVLRPFEKRWRGQDYALLARSVRKLSNLELNLLTMLAERLLSGIRSAQDRGDVLHFSARTAIGSIMSRNGSHNIGSHVLAALSHNVGTMPEDRKLYQYIQHRMDYIATATTEFPVWKQPMQLVGGILKTFMSQTHLLDYISRSEGLSAYRFQGTSFELDHQPNTIRLHARRLRTGCNEVHEVVEYEFIDYPDEKGGYESVRDVMVAIPGGVVGQHAVFTILENIIRNAAKHDWSTRRKANANDNLDIYIDFHDNVGRGRVEVLVYNKSAEPEKKIQSIVTALNAKINQSFLSEENGSLRRENWGLAEMRISAGYLNNASIEKIGGIGADTGRSSELIRAEAVKQGKGKACLGFRFDLPKPKELLIVLPKRNALGDKVIGKINLALGPYGIEVMTYDAMMSSKGLAYSFVLMEDVAEILSASDEAGWPGLPFRVLSSKPIKVKGWGQKNCPIIPTCNAYVDIVESLTKCSQMSEVSVFATKTLERAYACWICHVKGIRGINDDPVNLIVDPYQDGTSAGKSLVTDADLLHYVFNNSFNAAVRSFFKTVAPTTKECDLFFAGGLYLLAMSPKAGTLSVPELSAKKTAREMAYAQLLAWAMHLDGHEGTSTAKLDLEQTVQDGAPYVSDQWRAVLQDAQDSEETVRRACFASQLNSSFAERDVSANRFVDFLVDVVLEQSRSFLSRYEEQIATLPTSFQAGRADLLDSDGDKKPVPVLFSPVVKCGGSEMRHKKAVISLLVTKERSRAAEYAHTGVNYWRHGPENEKQAMLGSRLYLEPLSGSQTYFSSIEALAHERAKLKDLTSEGLPILAKVIRMVECGLVRIAIVDERAKKFRDAHPDVAGVFGMTGIAVYDDQDDLSEINSENCEVLIIHQGVIDKLVSDHTPENVGEYLRKWKARVRYVIVTTGRGMPSNIPSTARVLPFSIIESALFKRYPEKMLLVDNIMNILPKGERSDDCSVCGA